GPIVLVIALLDAALRPGSLATGARRWWKIVGLGSLATFAACLINPYGIRGALFPLETGATMTSEVFSLNIAELTPISEFIRRHGIAVLPLQLHFFTMALGALSFLVPLLWSLRVRFSGGRAGGGPKPTAEPELATSRSPGRRKEKADARSTASGKKGPTRKGKKADPVPEPATMSWRLSPFRLLLFLAFSYLSLQATR